MPSRDRPRIHRGTVTGYIFKLIRESIPRSQERLAANLGVDRGTVQGWESGRRPFTSVAFGQAVAARHRLARLGADTRLLPMLDQAAEADYLLDSVLDTDPATIDPAEHPLGWTVLTHPLTEMLAWAVVGQEPALLRGKQRPSNRAGPVPSTPSLEAVERSTFFANLHVTADRIGRCDHDHLLLHRQACFLAGLDTTGHAASWLNIAARSTYSLRTFHTWSSLWPDARSVATSLAKQGDPQLLRDFIARAHPDHACELAGLNYWAYWVGEIDRRQVNDFFMPNKSLSWRGGTLLRHLVDRLHADHPFIDLNIHSLWALLALRQGLVHDDPDLGGELLLHAEQVLDTGEISPQSRRELTSVLYGLRMTGLTSRGTGR
jgi:transcriptional regulator with XRE-family HTH domain